MNQRVEALEQEVTRLKKQLLLIERTLKQHEMHLRKLNNMSKQR